MKALFTAALILISQALPATFNLDIGSPKDPQMAQSPSSSTSTPQNSPPQKEPSLQDYMNAKQMEQMGLSGLSKTQQQSLTSWLQTYTKQVKTPPKPAADAVTSVVGDGHFVKLGDGSVWNISPNAWLYTYYWKEGDTIKVTKNTDLLFPYLLTNSSYNLPAPAQKATSQVSDGLSKSTTISSIQNGGAMVTLSDGTTWQIQSSAQYQAAGWSQGDVVYVIQNKYATGASYDLLNGSTSRSVQANPVKTNKNVAAKNTQKTNNGS